MKLRYEKNPEETIQDIRELFSYDILDGGRLILDRDDLAKLIKPEFLASILDEDDIFADWWPEVDDNEVKDVLNDKERDILSKMMGKETFDFDERCRDYAEGNN